jgi:hypothetical protein
LEIGQLAEEIRKLIEKHIEGVETADMITGGTADGRPAEIGVEFEDGTEIIISIESV